MLYGRTSKDTKANWYSQVLCLNVQCVITEIYASLKLHGLYLSFFKGALEDCAVEQEMFDGGEGSDSE